MVEKKPHPTSFESRLGKTIYTPDFLKKEPDGHVFTITDENSFEAHPHTQGNLDISLVEDLPQGDYKVKKPDKPVRIRYEAADGIDRVSQIEPDRVTFLKRKRGRQFGTLNY